VTKKGDMSGLYRNLLKTNTKYGGAVVGERAGAGGAVAAVGAGAASAAAAAAAPAPAPSRSPVAAASAAAPAPAPDADPPATDVERSLRPNPQVRDRTRLWEVESRFVAAGVVLSDAFQRTLSQDADDSGDDEEPAAAHGGGGAPVAVEAARPEAAAPAAPTRNKEEVAQSARERYLARKRKAGAS